MLLRRASHVTRAHLSKLITCHAFDFFTRALRTVFSKKIRVNFNEWGNQFLERKKPLLAWEKLVKARALYLIDYCLPCFICIHYCM